MTKEAFMNRCQSEFHCTPEAAERWCGWADDLHECDSGKADPKTGEVEEGDDPIISGYCRRAARLHCFCGAPVGGQGKITKTAAAYLYAHWFAGRCHGDAVAYGV